MLVANSDHQPGEYFAKLTERLSHASLRHRWEAYRDIKWGEPELQIHPEDPRWEVPSWDPLGASEWYRDQPVEQRSKLGLHRVAAFLKVGIEFEAALNEGLLHIASKLPNQHPSFRYLYHEMTEEAQHSMMFQEFINRSGLDIPGSSQPVREVFRTLVKSADDAPVLFFLSALSGEEVFDYLQRRTVADPSTHPLLRRIYQIHITEEARHLSFARCYLHDAVPRLTDRDMKLVRYRTPAIVEWTASQVFGPEQFLSQLSAGGEVPDDVRDSIVHGPAAAVNRYRSAARVIDLCHRLDLVDPRMESTWSKLKARLGTS